MEKIKESFDNKSVMSQSMLSQAYKEDGTQSSF